MKFSVQIRRADLIGLGIYLDEGDIAILIFRCVLLLKREMKK